MGYGPVTLQKACRARPCKSGLSGCSGSGPEQRASLCPGLRHTPSPCPAGQSNALDIAAALDFDADVLREARSLLRQLAPAGAGERASSLLGPLMEQADGYRTKATAAEGVLADVRTVHASIAEEAAGLTKRERRLQKAKVRRRDCGESVNIVVFAWDSRVAAFSRTLVAVCA